MNVWTFENLKTSMWTDVFGTENWFHGESDDTLFAFFSRFFSQTLGWDEFILMHINAAWGPKHHQ